MLSAVIIAFASNANSSTENHLFSYTVSEGVNPNPQTTSSNKNFKAKTVKINQSVDSTLSLGSKFAISFPNQTKIYNAKVTTELPSKVANLDDEISSSMKLIASLEQGAGSVEMLIENGEIKSLFITDSMNNKIYNVELDTKGEGELEELDFSRYQCAEFPESNNTNSQLNFPLSSELTPDLTTLQGLQSRPGATNVIYINNWGGHFIWYSLE